MGWAAATRKRGRVCTTECECWEDQLSRLLQFCLAFIPGLSSNINEQNYVKICDDGVCTGPISKTIDVTVTKNTRKSYINP